MIIAKGKTRTRQVKSCVYNSSTDKYDITFMGDKRYSYSRSNVSFLRNPNILRFQNCIISSPDGLSFLDVKQVYEFDDDGVKYWHFTSAGIPYDYKKDDLKITGESKTDYHVSSNVFEYLKDISGLSEIPNDFGEIILQKYYDKITSISEHSALYKYLNPKVPFDSLRGIIPVFPFGCNSSQYKAVLNALNNQISVIQGPPGTGKTQTILNIIANLIINGKSVLVVSNNNSATGNVLEKLSNPKYNMGFMVAPLGSSDNRNAFIEAQSGKYPDLSSWQKSIKPGFMTNVTALSNRLQRVYELREDIAILKEKKHEVELEYKYFADCINDSENGVISVRHRMGISADRVMKSIGEIQAFSEESGDLSWWFKLKSRWIYGLGDKEFYEHRFTDIITSLQDLYYRKTLQETEERIQKDEKELSDYPKDIEDSLIDQSLEFFKSIIAGRYKWNGARELFSDKSLLNKPERFAYEYPVVLSTTFSARACLNPNKHQFDYVIMDEASQVDVATGALALSVARNAVIVGDTKQLPNVITDETRKQADDIRRKYLIFEGYDYARNSFLQSVLSILPKAPVTLLREHYRCHPEIISFCNKKFYNNELLIMTEDDGNRNALKAIVTTLGNHSRGHYNQRQIDIIKNEVLPTLDVPDDEIGIIAPYNDQVNELRKQIPGIDISTVHKFQGREKDVIILSTVDDKIGDFTDDPNLLNVAVSRAKKQLIVVVSGNEQSKNGNIVDLVSYIRHNNMEVVDSKVFSVFDYLYSQYREQRWKYLKNKNRISQYDSENLIYNLLLEVLEDHTEYGVQCFTPLRMVVKDHSGLSEEEIRYLRNPNTHIDFMIYNKLSKLPVVAIEVDGYSFHKEGTDQHERDLKKDHILEVVGIPIVRLNTTGSGEKEKILSVIGM
jgi:superfamily I DNA and/or RNA helicase